MTERGSVAKTGLFRDRVNGLVSRLEHVLREQDPLAG